MQQDKCLTLKIPQVSANTRRGKSFQDEVMTTFFFLFSIRMKLLMGNALCVFLTRCRWGVELKTRRPASRSRGAIHVFVAPGLDCRNSLYFAVDQSPISRRQALQNAGCGASCLRRDNVIISHLLWRLFARFLSLSASALDFTSLFRMNKKKL